MVRKQNCVIWIQIQFHCMHKNRCIYKEILKVIETRFDTSNYELDKQFPAGKNKNVLGLNEDEVGRKIYEKICWIKSKNLQLLNR